VYEQAGFGAYELDPDSGTAEFWQKKISYWVRLFLGDEARCFEASTEPQFSAYRRREKRRKVQD
jgi:hypothetical protein